MKNFRAHSVFRASASCSKILNEKNIFHTVNSRQLRFSGQAQSCSKILNVKSIFNTVKFFRKNCSQGKRKLLKNPECKNYIQYCEKFQGTRCFQGKRKLLKNPECKKYTPYSDFKATLFFRASAKLLKNPECKKYI